MRLTGSRERSLGPDSRTADPHLIPTPGGAGARADNLMSIWFCTRRHSPAFTLHRHRHGEGQSMHLSTDERQVPTSLEPCL